MVNKYLLFKMAIRLSPFFSAAKIDVEVDEVNDLECSLYHTACIIHNITYIAYRKDHMNLLRSVQMYF